MKIMATEETEEQAQKQIVFIFQHRIENSLGNGLQFNPATKQLNYPKV